MPCVAGNRLAIANLPHFEKLRIDESVAAEAFLANGKQKWVKYGRELWRFLPGCQGKFMP